jgi:hypothetical protein
MTAEAKTIEQFDFTGAQWQAIRNAVLDGCDFPSAFHEDGLRTQARNYLQRMQNYNSPSVQRKKWRRVSKQLAQARATLITIARCDYDRIAYCDIAYRHDEWIVDWEDDAPASKDILAILDEWVGFCADRTRRCNHPRAVYFYWALDFWEHAGGHFRFSRRKPGSRHAGRPGGPTIRYLEAISLPVIGKAAPTAEAFAKIIERRARKPEILDPRLGKYLAKLEVSQSQAQARRIVRAISRLTDPR